VRLIINGEEREVHSQKLSELLGELKVAFPHFAVAINQQVVPRSKYESTSVEEGDKIEIVHAVGGGS
jgi:thiamine biosynthesis protein ThiS